LQTPPIAQANPNQQNSSSTYQPTKDAQNQPTTRRTKTEHTQPENKNKLIRRAGPPSSIEPPKKKAVHHKSRENTTNREKTNTTNQKEEAKTTAMENKTHRKKHATGAGEGRR
jgi:hypothetical protein